MWGSAGGPADGLPAGADRLLSIAHNCGASDCKYSYNQSSLPEGGFRTTFVNKTNMLSAAPMMDWAYGTVFSTT